MGTPEGAMLAMTLLIVWVTIWALILRRALRGLMRQRLLERVLLDRIERIERGAHAEAALPLAPGDGG